MEPKANSKTRPARAAELAHLNERALLQLSTAAYKVLRRLLRHADPEGYCWPSVRTLSRMRGLRDRHTIFRALRELEQGKFISRAQMMWQSTGAWAVNLYRVGASVRKLPQRAKERGYALVPHKRTTPTVKKPHDPLGRRKHTALVGKLRAQNSSNRNFSNPKMNSPPRRGVNGRGSLEEKATNLLVKELRGVPLERVRQAARLASLLASSPPNSVAYYRRAVPDVLANFEAKRLFWLTGEAQQRLKAHPEMRSADLLEEMKTLCARHRLSYDGEVVNYAIDRALRRLGEDAQLQSELRVGAFIG